MENKTATSPKKNEARPQPVRKDVRGAVSKPRSESVEFDPQLIWSTVRRCWLWATPTGLALAATAAFIVFSLFVPVYQATHLLESNTDYVVFRDTIPTPRNLANTEKNLIFTDLILDRVVSDPEIQVAPGFAAAIPAKELLRKNLSIGNAGADSLLTISFKNPDPKFAALVCNKVTESYLAQRERLDNERVTNLESWLAPSLDLWKTEVQGHEKRVRDLSKSALGFDPTKRVEHLENDLTLLSSLRMQLANLVAEESILEARVAMIATEQGKKMEVPATLPDIMVPPPTSIEIGKFVESDRDVQRLKGELATKELQVRTLTDKGLAPLRQDYVRDLQTQITALKKNLQAAEDAARQAAPEVLKKHALEVAERNRTSQLAQQQLAVQLDRNSEQMKLSELKLKRSIVQQEYDAEKARLEQHGGNTADLLFAQEDREIAVDILSVRPHQRRCRYRIAGPRPRHG
jgi:polysaccharide biosynthesis transport protein